MSKENRKTWEKELRKQRIIDAAEKVFFLKGPDAATLEEVAAEAGYHKRTLYLYFKDKEDLFLAVVLRGQQILRKMLRDTLDSSAENESGVFRLGRAFFDFFNRYPEYFSLIMVYEAKIHAYYNTRPNELRDEYRARCQELSMEYGRVVIEAIERDQAAGMVRSSLEPQQLMLLLWGQIFGVMQILLMRKEHFVDAYGISQEDLFGHFMTMARKSLQS